MKTLKYTSLKWLIAVILAWTLIVMLAVSSLAVEKTGKYEKLLLTVTSDCEVTITETATGWEILLFGKTVAGSCGSSDTHSTVTATLKITNTATKDNGSVRNVTCNLTTNGCTSDVKDKSYSWGAATDNATFTATSGSGSSNSTKITITVSGYDLESLGNNITTTFIPGAGGSYTVNDEKITASTNKSQYDTESYTLVATANDGYTLYGWATSAGMLDTAGTSTISYTGKDARTVWPVFRKNATDTLPQSAIYVIKDVSPAIYYSHLDEAIVATTGKENPIILVYESGSAYHSDPTKNSFTIPSGVTLLIPYSDANLFRGVPNEYNLHDYSLTRQGFPDPPEVSIVSAKTYTSVSDVEYRRLTLASDTHVTVNGALEVSGQSHPLAKGSFGNYGLIQMAEGSSITVNSGGALYAHGFIRGSGTVTANDGSTVYEHFDCLDYPGSGAGGLDEMNSAGVFPLRNYTMNNIEVQLDINAGTTYNIYLVMTGYSIGNNAFVRTFIGTTDTSVFKLTSGTITKSYASGRQKFDVKGEATLNPLEITIKNVPIYGEYKVDSSETSGLAISLSWDLTIADGATVTTADSVLLYAGATLTIDHGGKVIVPSGYNFYILDAASDPSTAANNAVMDVNGELQMDGKLYTSSKDGSFVGVTSNKGTGKVTIGAVGEAGTVGVRGSGDTSDTCNVIPARLQHADGTYMTAAVDTYTYNSETGKWECTNHNYINPVVTAPTCTVGGYTTHTCSACGNVKTDTETPATGHSYTDTVTAPTCTAKGYTTHTCQGCGYSYKDTETAALGHNFSNEWSTDGSNHWHACSRCSEVSENAAHADTVTKDHNCDTCGYTMSTCSDVTSDKDHSCDICGKEGITQHSYTSAVTTQPTCTKEGVKTYTCNCGHTYTESVAANGHSYASEVTAPTCTAEGYTTYICSGCGDTYMGDVKEANGHTNADPVVENRKEPSCTTDGSYDSVVRCSACGEEISRETIILKAQHTYTGNSFICTVCHLFEFRASNIRLGNNLDMLFAFPNFALDADLQGCYVKIVRTGEEDITIPVDQWRATSIDGVDCYYVIYSGFAAKEMCDEVTVTVHDSTGKELSTAWVDSIRAYCDRMLLKYNTSSHPKLVTLIADMLNYGAACQVFFDYNTGNLANAGLNVEGTTGEISWSQDYYTPGNSYFFGCNLIADSNSQFVVGFTTAAQGKSFTYTLTNHWNKKVERTVSADSLKLGSDSELREFYYHGLLNLRIADARLPFTITIDDNSWTDSVESYCRRMTEAANAVLNDESATADAKTNATKTIEVMTAFMRFSDAAKAYLHSTEVVD